MGIELVAATAHWLWDTFGEKISAISASAMRNKWKTVNWLHAENQYRQKIQAQLSTVRLLGNSTPIDVESIYTDVQVLDKLTAMRRFNFEAIKDSQASYDFFDANATRMSAFEVVKDHKRTYILGKPGAGKTTFLKNLAIQACRGLLKGTPIYISLKEWSDSPMDLLQFICEQFKICGFPNAQVVVEHLLKTGNALVLFDGLDEVNHEEKKRRRILQTITEFTNQYSESRFCLTCRIAANEYSFARFTYVEIADFNASQQNEFIKKWYSLEAKKLDLFQSQWTDGDNEKIRELGKTPLLLTLICLAFDETLQFSKRRVDLYAEAVDALLKKWDSSRAIVRGDSSRQLEPARKKQLLSFVAYNTFTRQEYIITIKALTNEIRRFTSSLPYWDVQEEPDADQILKTIESHHGLLVERAHDVYSFSHLTIQEFFAAQYILDNVASGCLDALVNNVVDDIRWREVMLMCSSSQSNASQLLGKFARKISEIATEDAYIVNCLEVIKSDRGQFSTVGRGHTISAINVYVRPCLEYVFEISGTLGLLPPQFRSESTYRARRLVKILLESKNSPNQAQADKLVRYLKLTILLIECLQISSVDKRMEIDEMVLTVITEV